MPEKTKDKTQNTIDADAFEREVTTDLDEETPDKPRGMALHTRILIGLAVGVIAGLAVNKGFGGDHPRVVWIVDNFTQPIGQLFLRLLLMIVVPLVFSSLVVGVAGIGDIRKLGRVGLKSFRLLSGDFRRFGSHRIDAGKHDQTGQAHRPGQLPRRCSSVTRLRRLRLSRRRKSPARLRHRSCKWSTLWCLQIRWHL